MLSLTKPRNKGLPAHKGAMMKLLQAHLLRRDFCGGENRRGREKALNVQTFWGFSLNPSQHVIEVAIVILSLLE